VDGETEVSTVSGKVEVADARGPILAKAVSGSIKLTVDGSAPVVIETVSGSVEVRVAPGRRPEIRGRPVAGRARIDVEEGHDFTITFRSLSGKVTVTHQ
jgi:DUF4097 and DUF4098 domain-containing protein YvlB